MKSSKKPFTKSAESADEQTAIETMEDNSLTKLKINNSGKRITSPPIWNRIIEDSSAMCITAQVLTRKVKSLELYFRINHAKLSIEPPYAGKQQLNCRKICNNWLNIEKQKQDRVLIKIKIDKDLSQSLWQNIDKKSRPKSLLSLSQETKIFMPLETDSLHKILDLIYSSQTCYFLNSLYRELAKPFVKPSDRDDFDILQKQNIDAQMQQENAIKLLRHVVFDEHGNPQIVLANELGQHTNDSVKNDKTLKDDGSRQNQELCKDYNQDGNWSLKSKPCVPFSEIHSNNDITRFFGGNYK